MVHGWTRIIWVIICHIWCFEKDNQDNRIQLRTTWTLDCRLTEIIQINLLLDPRASLREWGSATSTPIFQIYWQRMCPNTHYWGNQRQHFKNWLLKIHNHLSQNFYGSYQGVMVWLVIMAQLKVDGMWDCISQAAAIEINGNISGWLSPGIINLFGGSLGQRCSSESLGSELNLWSLSLVSRFTIII